MPTVSFRCPNPKCREVLAIPEDLRGLRARCAKCGHSFPVPLLCVRHLLEAASTEQPRRKAG